MHVATIKIINVKMGNFCIVPLLHSVSDIKGKGHNNATLNMGARL